MATVAIGNMKTPVRFEKNVPTLSDTGRPVDNYEEFLTTTGELTKLNGHKAMEVYQAGLKGTWRLRLRYQSALAAELHMNLKLRVVADNRFLTVESIETVGQIQKRWIVFILKESNVA